MSKIVTNPEKRDSIVWETLTVMLVITGFALNHPELLLYCQLAVLVILWLPIEALVGMSTGVSTSLFMPAVRLNGKPEAIWRVPFDQKSDANEMLVTRMVSWPVFVKLSARIMAPPAKGTPL